MSGVFIRGMKMPRGCLYCDIPISVISCPVNHGIVSQYAAKIHPECPFVFVPDHGRLIEAERLKEVFRRNVASGDAFDQLIDIAPTIIPATQGGEIEGQEEIGDG